MTRGPAPTPTHALKLRGSWRANERAGEPEAPLGAPVAPPWLTPCEMEGWNWLVDALQRMNLLSDVDMPSIALFAEAWGEFVTLHAKVQEEGWTLNTDKGNAVQNPTLGAKNRAAARVYQMAQQFGLSPAARTRIRTVEQKPKGADGKERFFA